MRGYPKARWSRGEASVGASVHTRRIPEGEGGGYYIYDWGYGDSHIILTELVQGTTKYQRINGQRSFYAEVGRIAVDPALVTGNAIPENEKTVARLILADMRERFDEIREWIPYDTDGKPVWFHEEVIKG